MQATVLSAFLLGCFFLFPGPEMLLKDHRLVEETIRILQTSPLVIWIPEPGPVQLRFFNADGKMVLLWMRDNVPAGVLVPRLATASLRPGVYILQLDSGGKTQLAKVVLGLGSQ